MSEEKITPSVHPSVPENSPESLIREMRAELDHLRAAKNDFETIKSAKTEIDQLKSKINQAKGSIDADLDSISQAKDRFSLLKQEINDQSAGVKNTIEKLNDEIKDLERTKETVSGVLENIETIKSQATQKKDSVDTDIQNISENKTEFERLRNEAQTIHSDLTSRQTDAQNKISEIENIHQKVDELFSDLLEDEKNEDNEIVKESKKKQILQLQNDIELLLNKISQDRIDSLSDTKTLKQTLEDEIRSLLPKAGAAGLSGAYVQAKSRYGSIPYDNNTDKGHKMILMWTWHQLVHRVPIFIYYAMFIIPLIIMTWLFYDLFKDLSQPTPDGIAKPKMDDILLLIRISLAIPLGIISLFGWSSIRLNRRLYEEYNHKQRVMQLYHSFKEEIDEIGDAEHKKALLTVMLKAVDDKPSLTMHKYDKGFESLIPAFSLGSLLSADKKI